MPTLNTDDGVKFHVGETGNGHKRRSRLTAQVIADQLCRGLNPTLRQTEMTVMGICAIVDRR